MSRIIAFDYGTKRIGIAVTDELQIISTALDTIPTSTIINFLNTYLSNNYVEMFVIGLPKNMNGTENIMTQNVIRFSTLLHNHFPNITIHFFDERLTSKIAAQTLFLSGLPKKTRQQKALLDQTAAAIILQDFMMSRQIERSIN